MLSLCVRRGSPTLWDFLGATSQISSLSSCALTVSVSSCSWTLMRRERSRSMAVVGARESERDSLPSCLLLLLMAVALILRSYVTVTIGESELLQQGRFSYLS